MSLGGGGGSGEGNNGGPSDGGDGGGIIIIHADEIETTGTCAGIVISANGETVPPSTQDGSSGAGAGGSIVLKTSLWDISGTCDLEVSANGGDGGNVDHPDSHGGGGGGGHGVVIFPLAVYTGNVNTDPGGGGDNNTGGGSVADPGGGTTGGGGGVETPPTAVCTDTTVYLQTGGTLTITGATVDGGSYDNGTIVSYDVDINTFDCTDIGANTVELIVTDNLGFTRILAIPRSPFPVHLW